MILEFIDKENKLYYFRSSAICGYKDNGIYAETEDHTITLFTKAGNFDLKVDSFILKDLDKSFDFE
jgi:hypothetical protein